MMKFDVKNIASRKNSVVETLLGQVRDISNHNLDVTHHVKASVEALDDYVEQFMTSDVITEDNPNFEELEHFFHYVSGTIHALSGLLDGYYDV